MTRQEKLEIARKIHLEYLHCDNFNDWTFDNFTYYELEKCDEPKEERCSMWYDKPKEDDELEKTINALEENNWDLMWKNKIIPVIIQALRIINNKLNQ